MDLVKGAKLLAALIAERREESPEPKPPAPAPEGALPVFGWIDVASEDDRADG